MDIAPFSDAIAGATKLFDDAIDRIWPTAQDKASAQAIAIKATSDAAIAQLSQQMSVMLEEAKSSDKWTSRARPSFMYVIYILILCGIPMGFMYAFDPVQAKGVAQGLQAWLAAIPQPLWDCFGYGYAGYLLTNSAKEHGSVANFLGIGQGGAKKK